MITPVTVACAAGMVLMAAAVWTSTGFRRKKKREGPPYQVDADRDR